MLLFDQRTRLNIYIGAVMFSFMHAESYVPMLYNSMLILGVLDMVSCHAGDFMLIVLTSYGCQNNT